MNLKLKKGRIKGFRPIGDVFFEALAVEPGVCEESRKARIQKFWK